MLTTSLRTSPSTSLEALDYAVHKGRNLIFRIIHDKDTAGEESSHEEDAESSDEEEESSEDDDNMEESDDDEEDEDEEEINIWYLISKEAKKDNCSVLKIFKQYVLFCRSLKRDEVYKTIMEAVQEKIKEDMDFDEALHSVVDKRQFLILRTANKIKQIARLEGKEWALTHN